MRMGDKVGSQLGAETRKQFGEDRSTAAAPPGFTIMAPKFNGCRPQRTASGSTCQRPAGDTGIKDGSRLVVGSLHMDFSHTPSSSLAGLPFPIIPDLYCVPSPASPGTLPSPVNPATNVSQSPSATVSSEHCTV
ncbi:hypothetical protein BHE74_00033606 [Ensete ventricosum]|nr:hypothetical protein BHE74_00033606 [Ensete ventricosum]